MITPSTTTVERHTVTLMTASVQCDRCPARAQVLAVLNAGGELLFCRHHAEVHRAALERTAVWIDIKVADSYMAAV